MNAKGNFIRAVYYQDPDYAPGTNEDTIAGFWSRGSFKREDRTDKGGVYWKITRTDMVPFPKGNP